MEGVEFPENFVSAQKYTNSLLVSIHERVFFFTFLDTTKLFRWLQNFVGGYKTVYLLVTSWSSEVFKDISCAKLNFPSSFEFFVFFKQEYFQEWQEERKLLNRANNFWALNFRSSIWWSDEKAKNGDFFFFFFLETIFWCNFLGNILCLGKFNFGAPHNKILKTQKKLCTTFLLLLDQQIELKLSNFEKNCFLLTLRSCPREKFNLLLFLQWKNRTIFYVLKTLLGRASKSNFQR